MIILTEHDRKMLKHIERFGGMTIRQCGAIFYNQTLYPYDLARKRLKKLLTMKEIGLIADKNLLTNEIVYTLDKGKKMSAHSLILMDCYAELIKNGAYITTFNREVPYMDGEIRADGYIEFLFNDGKFAYLIEVDVTHNADLKKYEKLYEAGCFKGTFPRILNITNSPERYKSNNFKIVYIDYKLTDFISLVMT